MKKFVVFLILVGIFFLLTSMVIRYINVQLAFKESSRSLTMSPEESKKEGLYIRTLSPVPSEVYLDKDYNVLIQKAWLEYDFKRLNKIFWIERKRLKERMVLKIVYAFKNRNTGEVNTNVSPWVTVHLINSKDDYFISTNYKNSVSNFVVGDIDEEFKLTISNGVGDGIDVAFK